MQRKCKGPGCQAQTSCTRMLSDSLGGYVCLYMCTMEICSAHTSLIQGNWWTALLLDEQQLGDSSHGRTGWARLPAAPWQGSWQATGALMVCVEGSAWAREASAGSYSLWRRQR